VPTSSFQLLQCNLRPKYLPSKKKKSSALSKHHQHIADISLNDQWNDLIIQPLTSLESGLYQKRLLIVIDALDEFDGDQDVRAILRLFSHVHTLTTFQMRIFITSRPETPIRLGFEKIDSILHHDIGPCKGGLCCRLLTRRVAVSIRIQR
jgi:hypothetical protein